MKHFYKLNFNTKNLVSALYIEEKNVRRFLMDGRNAAFLLKFRLSEELGFPLVEGKNAPANLIGKNGRIWIIKTCTVISGVSFCANSMIGSGRRFNSQKFFDSLKENIGFLVCNLECFPTIRVYKASPEKIIELCEKGLIKDGRLSFANFKALMEDK